MSAAVESRASVSGASAAALGGAAGAAAANAGVPSSDSAATTTHTMRTARVLSVDAVPVRPRSCGNPHAAWPARAPPGLADDRDAPQHHVATHRDAHKIHPRIDRPALIVAQEIGRAHV